VNWALGASALTAARRYAPAALVAVALAALWATEIRWWSSLIVVAGIAAAAVVAHQMRPQPPTERQLDQAARMAMEVLTQRMGRLSEGVLTIGQRAPRVSVNESLVNLWQLPPTADDTDPDEILASVFHCIKDAHILRADIAQLEREPSASIHHEVDLVDGRVFELHASSIQANAGSPLDRRSYFVFNDISNQANLGRRLQFANTLMQTQLESSPLGILVVDESGTITAHNRRFNEISRVPGISIASGDDSKAVALFAAQTKEPEQFLARVRYLYAHPEERADDEITMADDRILQRHSVTLRASGRSFGRVWYFADITALRTSERTANEERDFVAALLDSLPGYFVLIDAGGHLVRWNESLRFLNGLTDEQLLGANPFANVIGEDRAQIADKVCETIEHGSAVLEFRIQSRLGIRDLRWQGRRIMVDGKPHALAIGIDVTDVHAAEALRRESEKRFRDIFDSATEGIIIQDAVTGRFVDVNPHACEMFGYTQAELLAIDPVRLSVASEAEVFARRGSMVAAGGAPPKSFEWIFRAKDGREFWCDISSRRIANFAGRDVLLSMVRDITERRDAREAIAYRDRLLHTLTLSTAELVKASSLAGSMSAMLKSVGEQLDVDRLLVVQRTGMEHTAAGASITYGWQREGVKHIDLAKLAAPYTKHVIDPELDAWFAPLLRGLPVKAYASTATGIVRETLRYGDTVSNLLLPISVAGAYWGHFGVDDTRRVRRWSSTELDALKTLSDIVGAMITRDQNVAAIGRMATHDLLTDLPNRRFFIDALDAAIDQSKRSSVPFAVLYLDLDRFKDVNDTLGHPVGDRLLQAVGVRLLANVRAVDTVARFGGDEFAAIQVDVHDPDDAAVLADKIVHVLSEPFDIGTNEIRSAASLGIALYGPDSPDAESLLAHADVALYRAKADGRGSYRFYTESMDTAVRQRVTLEREMRDALTLGQYFLVYQPQVDCFDGRIVGVEALVRWQHPTRGVVTPESFIPAAEKSGLIVALGAWVIREACRQTRAWLDASIAPPVVAVNLSVLQFGAPRDFEQGLADTIAEFGITAERIELELTESVMMQATQQHGDLLLRLRSRGFRIAIDDFGNGYSSLDYLRRFHVDRLKIPENFIHDLGIVSESAPIVRATISLAHELGITTVAEGVETAMQLEFLRGWGCREIQGYYYSQPLSAADAAAVLRVGTLAPSAPHTIG
jgi:diguanylate cyclase (GGDEF)-like protein/PAS domain S-box-containing protein